MLDRKTLRDRFLAIAPHIPHQVGVGHCIPIILLTLGFHSADSAEQAAGAHIGKHSDRDAK